MTILFFTILIVGMIAAVLVMASKKDSPKQLNEQSKDEKLKNSSPIELANIHFSARSCQSQEGNPTVAFYWNEISFVTYGDQKWK